MSEPRTIDDLVLSPAGEEARRLAQLAILDGRPLDDIPEPEPTPEPVPAHVRASRERHNQFLARVFRYRQGHRPAPRGVELAPYPEWLVDLLHDENEAAPDLCRPVLPEPEVRAGTILWGASATISPPVRFDPECAFEARLDDREVAGGPVPTGPVADDVVAWLEGLREPMTVEDLAEMTGHAPDRVLAACRAWRSAGRVARQHTGGGPVWVWRRAPL